MYVEEHYLIYSKVYVYFNYLYHSSRIISIFLSGTNNVDKTCPSFMQMKYYYSSQNEIYITYVKIHIDYNNEKVQIGVHLR